MQLKKLFFVSGLAAMACMFPSCSQDNDSPDIATIETNFKDEIGRAHV